MDYKTSLIQPEQIEQAVLLIRGQRVMLDRDLAALYGVETGNLNKAVQRNADRFPADFMFQLNDEETADLIFQFGRPRRHGGSRFNPYVFTQEGVAMLSSVLRSPRAVQVNIAIMRVFVRLRETLALHKDLAQKLAQLERKIEVHPLSASIGERVRVRCRFGICHPTAGETAPRNRLSRHSQGRCRSGQSESKTQMKPANLDQPSTLNSQPSKKQPAGK